MTRLRMACLLIVMVLLGINLASCEPVPPASTPLLPPGLASLIVPDVDLQGLIYVNQGTPINVSSDVAPGVIPELSIESAEAWLGPDTDSIGGSVTFTSEAYSQKTSQLLSALNLPVWNLASGRTLFASSNNPGQWDALLKTRVQQQFINVATKYPEVQSDFAYFPASPSLKPMAAGFVDIEGGLVKSIGSKFNVSLTGYISGLRSARVSRISFVGYDTQTITISSKTTNLQYLQYLQPAVLAVARSGYPGVVLSVFFDKAMSDAGFNKYNLNNVDLYEYPATGVKLIIARKDNIVFASIAQTKSTAENFLLSCFIPRNSNTTGAGPVILGPTGGASNLDPNLVGFAWAPVSGATEYTITVATDAALTKTVSGTPAKVTSPAYQATGMAYGTTYFWAVQATQPTVGIQTISTFTTMQIPNGGG